MARTIPAPRATCKILLVFRGGMHYSARRMRKASKDKPPTNRGSGDRSPRLALVDVHLLLRIATRVRRLRKERGLTARELAERSALSLRFIAELEAGRANIAVLRLDGVANALGVSLASLVAAPVDSSDDDGVASGPRARLEELLEGRTPAEL